ncbi:MAG: pyridoxal-phosphate dependent enzyme [Gammaproteobacteria bacterium]|nr:pyridoxal-phosphate dependent enzyme [Gammaproteobacteria bacterium]
MEHQGVLLEEVRAAQRRIESSAVQTPLVRLDVPAAPAEIHLKLENLQAVGSFKVRPVANVLLNLRESDVRHGAWTASSGNAGIALTWVATRMGVAAAVVVPENAPAIKIDRLRELGAAVHRVAEEEWWEVICSRHWAGTEGIFVDAVRDVRAMAGNGTIGLEILAQLPEVDTILVPFGGGGLSAGIASAVKAVNPAVRVIACESELATPLSAAVTAGRPVEVEVRPGWISGIGAASVLPEMWPLLKNLLDGTRVVSQVQVVHAIRTMVEHCHVVSEGAGAVGVAAALSGTVPGRKLVCVVSGGNIDAADLAEILAGHVPGQIRGQYT